MLIKYLFLILLWILWCFFHSIMISKSLTDYLKNRFEKLFIFYRLFFNLTAIITIIPVLIYTYSIKTSPIFTWDGYLRIIQILMLLTAVYLCFAGAKQYNLSQVMGLAQIREKSSTSLISQDNKINIAGIHRIIRHPWYSAVFLLIWAQNMDISGLIVNIILTIYLVTGTVLEEKKLVQSIGRDYQEYQKKADMFFPVKWIAGKILRNCC
ncbi:NnrU domain-containing protein [Desulfonema limicola]|uniref:NnrU domain-containing protein n=1 Tax=Desulfonema limicola TaxID=45656 RepID=A0A975BB08_9BACT|nr:NnrU family protein [Desulfonema limicola]QTA82042.1 NnrU domain-containing protein [Desulfonema limicola]